MPHQSALTIVANVRPGETDSLRRLLGTMGDGVANGSVVDFETLTGLHFARLVLLEETHDLRGEPLPASLVYMSDLDVSGDRHLGDLVDTAGAGIDLLFDHCEGYPDGAQRARDERLAYLRRHVVAEQVRYVNTIGRGARQIRQEAQLRDRLESFLDGRPHDPGEDDPVAIRRAVQEFVENDEAFHWARWPAGRLPLSFRVKELAHFLGGLLLVLLLAPFLLLAAPVFFVLLRLHERSDRAPHERPPPELVQELAALDDHLVHNPFTAIGFVKPGLFRRLTLTGVLIALAFATRHVFGSGNLAGVKTIHFARWVVLNDKRRVIFASSYDGSLESYMDDFVDKIWWGLNLAFSNGYGFPRTRWLFLDGSRDELAFKDFLRLHQVPTRVWYSAYGRLTTANIASNERIRSGLRGAAGPDEARGWLQAL
jgi:hypothetical protein